MRKPFATFINKAPKYVAASTPLAKSPAGPVS